MSGWVLGIDFGTCFTCAAISQDGRVEVVEPPGGRGRMPSAALLDEDGGVVVGHRAAGLAVMFPDRAVRLPKRALADGPVLLVAGREVRTAEIAAAVLKAAAAEAVRQAGGQPPDRVVLTCPALWGPEERQRLADAADRAGLGTVELVDEPEAAARFYAAGGDGVVAAPVPAGGRVAVFDFGGGTLDIAVLERTADGFALAGPPGGDPRLGGEDLDEALRALVERKVADKGGGPAWDELWAGTSRQARQSQRLLLTSITEAKEELFDPSGAADPLAGPAAYTYVHVPLPGLDGDVTAPRVTRDEFTETVRPLVERAVGELVRTIDAARVRGGDLAGIYLTGGSSRVELVGRLIHRRLGRDPEQYGDPKAVVVKGALTPLAPALARPAIPAPPEIQRAERIARAITIDHTRARALSMVAAALARTDPHGAVVVADEAAKLAGTVPDDVTRAALLPDLITATSQAAPDRAARWTAEAEQVIAAMDNDSYSKRQCVKALAKAAPAAVGRIAETLAGDARDYLLIDVAEAAARDHPDEAERIARTITSQESRAQAQEKVVVALAAVDPDRAERMARSIANEYREEFDDGAEAILVSLARELIGTDPGRAEWITRSLADIWWREKADLLERLAAAARGDPQRARRLGQLAEDELANVSPAGRADALIQMTEVASAYDPDRALHLADVAQAAAEEIPDHRRGGPDRSKAAALSRLARAVAGTDPRRAARLADEAEAVARAIPRPDDWAVALREVALAIAVTDPWRAVVIAEELRRADTDKPGKKTSRRDEWVRPLSQIAVALASSAPEAADRVAQMIAGSQDRRRDDRLADVAKAMAPSDPVRAERIAAMIQREYMKTNAMQDIVRSAAAVDLVAAERIASGTWSADDLDAFYILIQEAAKTDADRAERIAGTVHVEDVSKQEVLLTGLIYVLARTDPDRAERVAGAIATPERRQHALWVLVQQLTGSTGFF